MCSVIAASYNDDIRCTAARRRSTSCPELGIRFPAGDLDEVVARLREATGFGELQALAGQVTQLAAADVTRA